MDFAQDADVFGNNLGRAARDIKHAQDNFLANIDHWKLLSKNRWGDLVSVDLLPERKGISGTVLGKSFVMHISPISADAVGMIEVILTLPALDGEPTEIGRFKVGRDGNLVGEGEPDTSSAYDQLTSIKIFMAVVKSVMEAPTPLSA